jgi:hypothetical protein
VRSRCGVFLAAIRALLWVGSCAVDRRSRAFAPSVVQDRHRNGFSVVLVHF